MLLLLSGAAQELVIDFEEYVGLGVFQPVTTIESQEFLFTDYAGSYMIVASWTWDSIPLVPPLVGDVALYIPDDAGPVVKYCQVQPADRGLGGKESSGFYCRATCRQGLGGVV